MSDTPNARKPREFKIHGTDACNKCETGRVTLFIANESCISCDPKSYELLPKQVPELNEMERNGFSKKIFDEWNSVTGLVVKDSAYYWELISLMNDTYDEGYARAVKDMGGE